MKMLSPNHWTTREFPNWVLKRSPASVCRGFRLNVHLHVTFAPVICQAQGPKDLSLIEWRSVLGREVGS